MPPIWERESTEYRVALYEYRDGRVGRASRYYVHATWRVPGRVPGARPTCARGRTPAGSDRDYAVAECERHWRDYLDGAVSAPEAPPGTVGELIDAFLARTEGRDGRLLRAGTRRAYECHLDPLRTVAGTLPVDRLTRAHVERAIGHWPAASSQASTLRAVRVLLRWATERGWAAGDASFGLRVHVEHVLRPWIRRADLARFLAACRPAHRIRAALLVATGLRVTEALSLRWSWIIRDDAARPMLVVPSFDAASGFHTKGHGARSVPLSHAALAALDLARAEWGGTGYVLHPTADGGKLPWRSGWNAAQNVACAEAGIERVDVHGLRRTAGALWLLAGVPIHVVSRWLGHSSVLITERHYAGIDEAAALAAIDLVDGAERD